jgi:ribosomal protein S18 acetylase RimI-like enzyme
MTMKNIRRATLDDVPAITQIRNDAHAKKVTYGDHAWGKEGDGFSEGWVHNHVAKRPVYVVECHRILAGAFSLDFDDDAHWGLQEPVAGYVHGLCVRKGFNGAGLGSFMLDWCADTVRGVNRRFVRLDCAVQNTRLCAYYEALGFVRVGVKQDGYLWSLYERAVD